MLSHGKSNKNFPCFPLLPAHSSTSPPPPPPPPSSPSSSSLLPLPSPSSPSLLLLPLSYSIIPLRRSQRNDEGVPPPGMEVHAGQEQTLWVWEEPQPHSGSGRIRLPALWCLPDLDQTVSRLRGGSLTHLGEGDGIQGVGGLHKKVFWKPVTGCGSKDIVGQGTSSGPGLRWRVRQ